MCRVCILRHVRWSSTADHGCGRPRSKVSTRRQRHRHEGTRIQAQASSTAALVCEGGHRRGRGRCHCRCRWGEDASGEGCLAVQVGGQPRRNRHGCWTVCRSWLRRGPATVIRRAVWTIWESEAREVGIESARYDLVRLATWIRYQAFTAQTRRGQIGRVWQMRSGRATRVPASVLDGDTLTAACKNEACREEIETRAITRAFGQ
jgi:hypothetical protein